MPAPAIGAKCVRGAPGPLCNPDGRCVTPPARGARTQLHRSSFQHAHRQRWSAGLSRTAIARTPSPLGACSATGWSRRSSASGGSPRRDGRMTRSRRSSGIARRWIRTISQVPGREPVPRPKATGGWPIVRRRHRGLRRRFRWIACVQLTSLSPSRQETPGSGSARAASRARWCGRVRWVWPTASAAAATWQRSSPRRRVRRCCSRSRRCWPPTRCGARLGARMGQECGGAAWGAVCLVVSTAVGSTVKSRWLGGCDGLGAASVCNEAGQAPLVTSRARAPPPPAVKLGCVRWRRRWCCLPPRAWP